MAEALGLLVPVPFVLAVIAFAVGICALEFFVSYDRYSLVLRWLALDLRVRARAGVCAQRAGAGVRS